MLETTISILLLLYLIIVLGIKLTVLIQYVFEKVTGKQALIGIFVAWFWPVWILLGFCWADGMNKFISEL